MKLLSALKSLLGLGGKSFEPAPVAQRVEAKTPVLAPEAHVHRGGKHSRGMSMRRCSICLHTLSKLRCLNRMCPDFHGRMAHTHPDLLSLDRPVRMEALDRWARGGTAALFATAA
jgi:hypothetical protein